MSKKPRGGHPLQGQIDAARGLAVGRRCCRPGQSDYRQAPQGDVLVLPTLDRVRAWREEAESLARVEGVEQTEVTLLERGAPSKADRITSGLFDFLGVAPAVSWGVEAALGPGGGSGGERRVILTHAL